MAAPFFAFGPLSRVQHLPNPTKLAVLELDHATPAANARTLFADHCKVVIAPFWNPSKLM